MVDATPARAPERITLKGRYCTLRPLDPVRDSDGLFTLSHGAEMESQWAYLGAGPFEKREDFAKMVESHAVSNDPFFYAVTDRDDNAIGWLSLMRIDRANRVIEIGWILYTPALQRSAAATEAQYLAARYVFEILGYRRYEWKCNALNAPSMRAACRFGFSYEGLFRQHMIVKGRNRDTAWFSMLDSEWPACKAAFEAWLAPANFKDGQQLRALGSLNDAEVRLRALPVIEG